MNSIFYKEDTQRQEVSIPKILIIKNK